MEWVEIEAATRAKAEAKALEVFGTDDINSLEIEEVKVTRKFLGMGGKVVKLRARRKEVEEEEIVEEEIATEEEPEETMVESSPAVEEVKEEKEEFKEEVITQDSKYRPWVAEGPSGVVIPRSGKGYGRRLYSMEPSMSERVSASSKKPSKTPPAAAIEEVEEEEFVPEVYEDFKDSPITEESRARAVDFIKRTIKDMGIEGEVKGYRLEDRLLIQISSESSGLLIGRKGETLESLQYLVDIIINRRLENRIRIVVDADYYRERKRMKLINSAKAAAENVVRTHNSLALAPMNPAERRLIHVTLAKDTRVETESEGEGSRRRVVVYLKGASRKKPFKKKGSGRNWRR